MADGCGHPRGIFATIVPRTLPLRPIKKSIIRNGFFDGKVFRAAGNRTQSTPTPWARTAGILQPEEERVGLRSVECFYAVYASFFTLARSWIGNPLQIRISPFFACRVKVSTQFFVGGFYLRSFTAYATLFHKFKSQNFGVFLKIFKCLHYFSLSLLYCQLWMPKLSILFFST